MTMINHSNREHFTIDDLAQPHYEPADTWVTSYRGQMATTHDIYNGNVHSGNANGTPYVYRECGQIVDPSEARDTDLVCLQGLEMTVGAAISLGLLQDF
ncbi:hypothetical protein [Enterovibrio calviensis]|uniref:hypothetical protein n=1 Tax=Enterovibrio calviensis TaxID=91359 RepID=UPI0037369566